MVREAARIGLREVYVHPLLDGRDVPETSALLYLEKLEGVLAEYDGKDGRRYRIASGGGRMVTTMDRYEANWRIVERGWNAHVHGTGPCLPIREGGCRDLPDGGPGDDRPVPPGFRHRR